MNFPRCVVLVFCGLIGSFALGDDRIMSVDQQNKLLTVEQGGVLKLYHAVDTAEITVNGAKAAFPQLLAGQTVAVKVSGAITAVKIAASGLGNTSAPARPLMLRSLTVQMRVDGSDRVLYQDGKLWIEHMTAQKPAAMIINGVEWTPTWTGDKTEPLTIFTVPLAPIAQGCVAMKQFAGRSKVKQEHVPAAPAVVTISDDPSGADNYEFQFTW